MPTWVPYAITTAALGFIVWYFKWSLQRILDGFQSSITDLYKKHDTLSAEFNELKGEHRVNHRLMSIGGERQGG